jgi:hypothetical protein
MGNLMESPAASARFQISTTSPITRPARRNVKPHDCSVATRGSRPWLSGWRERLRRMHRGAKQADSPEETRRT